MKVGIMQPYFFPYLGYFSLIKNIDKFILFDTVQFIKHGWIERNRVLKQQNGWIYIAVPLVKHPRDTKIKDIIIDNSKDWKNKILAQLEHYKKIAPYYYKTIKVVKEALDIETDSIVEVNKHCLEVVCGYLDIDTDIEIFSDMKLPIEEVKEPDEWALNICKSLKNIDEYWNPEGGLEFFDRQKYIDNNIKINFLKMNLISYDQKKYTDAFEAGLSIIDVMMFNTKEEIHEMLDNYELL